MLPSSLRYEMYTGDVKPAISVTGDAQSPDTSNSNPNALHNLDPGAAVEVLELANGETIWWVPLDLHTRTQILNDRTLFIGPSSMAFVTMTKSQFMETGQVLSPNTRYVTTKECKCSSRSTEGKDPKIARRPSCPARSPPRKDRSARRLRYA
jgi:hypothetical protein